MHSIPHIDQETYLIDHIRDQTLHLICVQPLAIALPHSQPNRSIKLHQRDPRPADPILLRLALLEGLVPARDEHLAQQVPERDVAASLEGQVDPAFDELGLASGERGVEASEVAALDAGAQRGEELLEARVGREEGRGREGVRCQKVAWDEVGENQSGCVVSALVKSQRKGEVNALAILDCVLVASTPCLCEVFFGLKKPLA
jgi:hypothetical protein